MPKILRISLCLIQCLPIIAESTVCSQISDSNSVRFMFYNVENLFDIFDDTLTDDNEFLPRGIMHWNSYRYGNKINSLYKTIVAAGDWNPPAVVAMCEVENRNVIEDILFNTNLSKFKYKIIHEESADTRGIDVCLIYRPEIISVLDYNYWTPADINKADYKTRSVLFAKMVVNSDTIFIIVNHWPSRRGGVLAGEDLRLKIASMVREKVDSIYLNSKGKAKVVIMGDFNSNPDDIAIKTLIENREKSGILINLSEKMPETIGSYRYKGVWEMIDQVIVSKNLLSGHEGAYTDRNGLHIFDADFLIEKDPNYPGSVPSPSYRGTHYNGGTSDHLPVILSIFFRDPVSEE